MLCTVGSSQFAMGGARAMAFSTAGAAVPCRQWIDQGAEDFVDTSMDDFGRCLARITNLKGRKQRRSYEVIMVSAGAYVAREYHACWRGHFHAI